METAPLNVDDEIYINWHVKIDGEGVDEKIGGSDSTYRERIVEAIEEKWS